jgi:hypothetical protein
LVIPANRSEGRVSETTRMFQVASAALNSPARRPTRGSGFGAAVDMALAGDGALPLEAAEDETVEAHAAADNSPTASESFDDEKERDMASVGENGVTVIGSQR